jgi:hypothetical protein
LKAQFQNILGRIQKILAYDNTLKKIT